MKWQENAKVVRCGFSVYALVSKKNIWETVTPCCHDGTFGPVYLSYPLFFSVSAQFFHSVGWRPFSKSEKMKNWRAQHSRVFTWHFNISLKLWLPIEINALFWIELDLGIDIGAHYTVAGSNGFWTTHRININDNNNNSNNHNNWYCNVYAHVRDKLPQNNPIAKCMHVNDMLWRIHTYLVFIAVSLFSGYLFRGEFPICLSLSWIWTCNFGWWHNQKIIIIKITKR